MNSSVLLVEDNEATCLLVKAMMGPQTTFKRAGDTVEAFQILQTEKPDLLLLDVDLPGEDGYQFCARLRADQRYHEIPIIFLTGKSSLTDKVMGFSIGADDYVTKPFNTIELKARIEAKLRRYRERRALGANFIRGDFEVDLNKQRIAIKTPSGFQWLTLTTTEYRLLNHFICHPDRVFTRAQILDEVWGNEAHVSDRTIDAHIYMIRQKLGEKSRTIKAIKGVGYIFSQDGLTGG
jgi:two-component system phosphate regulon response regulator PhoB